MPQIADNDHTKVDDLIFSSIASASPCTLLLAFLGISDLLLSNDGRIFQGFTSKSGQNLTSSIHIDPLMSLDHNVFPNYLTCLLGQLLYACKEFQLNTKPPQGKKYHIYSLGI